MQHLTTYLSRFSFSMLRMALLPGFCLLCFGAANGLASQQVRALRIQKAVLVGDGWPALGTGANMIYHYYIGDPPSYLEAFPELWGLKQNNSGPPNYIIDYVPYGTYPLNVGGYVKYPYFYRLSGSIDAGTVPDDFSSDDLNNLNSSYNNLPEDQKFALNGRVSFGSQSIDGQNYPVYHFDTKPVGSSTGTGGVYTYDSSGNVVQSFPDGSGYASGFKQNADGSFTPVYYQINGDTITEASSIPTTDYSSLTYDTDTGQYSLNVPDYSAQLDTIISRIDNIDLHVPDIIVNPDVTVNVPAPEVTVNPDITVNPDVTVNVPAPEVTVTIPDSISSSLGTISSAVSNIQDNTEVSGDIASMPSFADLTLTSDEQSLVSRYSDWETNIPVIGDAVDFGLTTLFGQLPKVGTEYVWLDYTIGDGSPSKRSSLKASASSVNPLNGYRLRIDLTAYREVLLAARGVMVIGEALLFLALCYRDIKKALAV